MAGGVERRAEKVFPSGNTLCNLRKGFCYGETSGLAFCVRIQAARPAVLRRWKHSTASGQSRSRKEPRKTDSNPSVHASFKRTQDCEGVRVRPATGVAGWKKSQTYEQVRMAPQTCGKNQPILPIRLYFSLSIYPPSFFSVYLTSYLCICLSFCVSKSIYLSMSMYLSCLLYLYPSLDFPIDLFLAFYLSMHLSMDICIHSINLPVYLSISLYVSLVLSILLSPYLSIYLSIYLSMYVCMSVCMYVCMCV